MIADGIERFAVLEGLTPEESDTIVRRCGIITAKKGEKVFEEGKHASSLFLVRSGSIKLRFKVVYFNGVVEIPLESVGAGGVCGWSAMIPPHSYTLTACATEDSELLQIKQTDLQDVCEANAHLGYIVMKNIARIIGERYELARQILVGEIQRDLKRKENKGLWKDA